LQGNEKVLWAESNIYQKAFSAFLFFSAVFFFLFFYPIFMNKRESLISDLIGHNRSYESIMGFLFANYWVAAAIGVFLIVFCLLAAALLLRSLKKVTKVTDEGIF